MFDLKKMMKGGPAKTAVVTTWVTIFLLYVLNSPMMYMEVQGLLSKLVPGIELIKNSEPTILGMALHALVFALAIGIVVNQTKAIFA